MQSDNQPRKIAVYLNVYDLEESIKYNDYTYYLGFGVFHSGLVLFGQEYSFGAHDEDTSGIFWVEPGTVPMCKFRSQVDLGHIVISKNDLNDVLEELGRKFTGTSYHNLQRNCNHFTEEFCHRTGIYFPGWINRLSKVMNYCQCLVPPKYLQSPTAPPAEDTHSPYTPFSGEGHKLSSNGTTSSTIINISNNNNTDLIEDKETRRKLLEQATLRRLNAYDAVAPVKQ